jgi:hypothetical protein
MGNINSLKEFLKVYESIGDEFFIWGEQYDPYPIKSSSCDSFKPSDSDEFISEFLELKKYSLCEEIEYDFDSEDSEHYVNKESCIYIDKNEPELGVCRIVDFIKGGDSIYELPGMNSISTYTRNIVSTLCEYSDLKLLDITPKIIEGGDEEFNMYIREKIECGLDPFKTIPSPLLEIFNLSSQKNMNLIEFNSLIFNEKFGFGGIVNYFLKDPKQLTCSTLMGATEWANTPMSDKTIIGINKYSSLVEYVRVPYSLSN